VAKKHFSYLFDFDNMSMTNH